MSRYRDTQLQVGKNYIYLYNMNQTYTNIANTMLISHIHFEGQIERLKTSIDEIRTLGVKLSKISGTSTVR